MPTGPEARRRSVAAACMAAAAMASAASPAVNLQVELRTVAEPQAATAGEVTVGTQGGTPPVPGSVTHGTVRTAPRDEVLQVLVRNGERAVLQHSRWRALPTGEWFMGGSRPGFGQTRVWVDDSRGLGVRPSWPGGSEPVTVELSVEGDRRVATTLAVEPGTWTAFARFGAGLSARVLQLRVTPPAP